MSVRGWTEGWVDSSSTAQCELFAVAAAALGRVSVAVFIAHGEADELVPFAMVTELWAAATASPRVVFHPIRGGDHNSSWLTGGPPYWAAWRSFLIAIGQSRDDG